MHLETLAIHAGRHPDPVTGDVAPAIHVSSTFQRGEDGSFPSGNSYSRAGNPSRNALETALAALEGGAVACAFASGTAASYAVFQACAPGDHVIIPTDVYHGTRLQMNVLLQGWGLQATAVDLHVPGALAAALRPNTKLVWLETPSNPLLHVTDIADCCRVAHAAGVRVVVDSTFATPVLQRPFELGADVVMHSTSKYLGGHSDLIGGVVIGREDDAFMQKVRLLQWAGGAVPSPFDCWLLQRSIASLPCRVRAHVDGAMRVAAFLVSHPAISHVLYPGLPSHPGHALAARQMKGGFGAMMSIRLAAGREAAIRVAARVKVFTRATSLGGVESLMEHRASVEGPNTATPDDLLRLSVGLEHPDDLIADLVQALG
jgi:cystathionine gamma-synthase